MKTRQFDLGQILADKRISTEEFIAPTIYRLAESQKQWRLGERDVDVRFRPTLRGKVRDTIVRITWDLGSIALDHEYPGVREDRRKLRISKNEGDINVLLGAKRRQILLNESLRRAMVSVIRFAEPTSLLERVR